MISAMMPSGADARSAARIERIAEMYKWGDLTREAYRGEREQLEAELGDAPGGDESGRGAGAGGDAS